MFRASSRLLLGSSRVRNRSSSVRRSALTAAACWGDAIRTGSRMPDWTPGARPLSDWHSRGAAAHQVLGGGNMARRQPLVRVAHGGYGVDAGFAPE
jgi:hypothetical protein